jgi:hypothetical protein
LPKALPVNRPTNVARNRTNASVVLFTIPKLSIANPVAHLLGKFQVAVAKIVKDNKSAH